MELYVIVGIGICLLIYIFVIYNSLVKLNNSVKEAFSIMDVYLKKRWDLILSIVEVVKGYAKHEKETLKEVIELRNGNYEEMNENKKLKTNEELTTKISKLMMLVENYPELKADKNFLDLSKQLSEIENDIAISRKFYNANVRDLNNKVEMFPSNIISKIFKYKTKSFFEIYESERKNIKIDL